MLFLIQNLDENDLNNLVFDLVKQIGDILVSLITSNVILPNLDQSSPSISDPHFDSFSTLIRPSNTLFACLSFLLQTVDCLAVIVSKQESIEELDFLKNTVSNLGSIIFEGIITFIGNQLTSTPVILALKSLLHCSVVCKIESLSNQCLNSLIYVAGKGSVLSCFVVFSSVFSLSSLISNEQDWRQILRMILNIKNLTFPDVVSCEAQLVQRSLDFFEPFLPLYCSEVSLTDLSTLKLFFFSLVKHKFSKFVHFWPVFSQFFSSVFADNNTVGGPIKVSLLELIFDLISSIHQTQSSKPVNTSNFDSSKLKSFANDFVFLLPSTHSFHIPSIFPTNTGQFSFISGEEVVDFEVSTSSLSTFTKNIFESILVPKILDSHDVFSSLVSLFITSTNDLPVQMIPSIELFTERLLSVEPKSDKIDEFSKIFVTICEQSPDIFGVDYCKILCKCLSSLTKYCISNSKSYVSAGLRVATVLMNFSEVFGQDPELFCLFMNTFLELSCLSVDNDISSSCVSILMTLVSTADLSEDDVYTKYFPSIINVYSTLTSSYVSRHHFGCVVYESSVMALIAGLPSVFVKFSKYFTTKHEELISELLLNVLIFLKHHF
ncbi:hypothetical protein GEMRC1_011065 [Eukaryota sp. GEM-RC1]